MYYAAGLKECLRDNQLIVGCRQVKSVDYFNRFKTSVLLETLTSAEVEVHALTFTYYVKPTIDKAFVETGPHKGKIQIFIDPSDGEWKILEISLPY